MCVRQKPSPPPPPALRTLRAAAMLRILCPTSTGRMEQSPQTHQTSGQARATSASLRARTAAWGSRSSHAASEASRGCRGPPLWQRLRGPLAGLGGARRGVCSVGRLATKSHKLPGSADKLETLSKRGALARRSGGKRRRCANERPRMSQSNGIFDRSTIAKFVSARHAGKTSFSPEAAKRSSMSQQFGPWVPIRRIVKETQIPPQIGHMLSPM